MTSTEFSLLTHVVNTNQQGPASTGAVIRNKLKGIMDIEGTRRSELGNLGVRPRTENIAHTHKHFLERKVVIGLFMVGVQELQQSRRASTTGATGGVGELKGSHVGHICGGLRVATTGYHADFSGNGLFGFCDGFGRHDGLFVSCNVSFELGCGEGVEGCAVTVNSDCDFYFDSDFDCDFDCDSWSYSWLDLGNGERAS